MNLFLKSLFLLGLTLNSLTVTQAEANCVASEYTTNSPECNYCGQNCSLPEHYWKLHPECWGSDFDPETASIGGLLWTSILETPTLERPWYVLAHQYVTASLNIAKANGDFADCLDGRLLDALSEAALMLNSMDKEALNSKQARNCLKVAALLSDFNNGILGGSCPQYCRELKTNLSDPCADCPVAECPVIECPVVEYTPCNCDDSSTKADTKKSKKRKSYSRNKCNE